MYGHLLGYGRDDCTPRSMYANLEKLIFMVSEMRARGVCRVMS